MNYEVRKKENNRKKRKKYAASIPSFNLLEKPSGRFLYKVLLCARRRDSCSQGVCERSPPGPLRALIAASRCEAAPGALGEAEGILPVGFQPSLFVPSPPAVCASDPPRPRRGLRRPALHMKPRV